MNKLFTTIIALFSTTLAFAECPTCFKPAVEEKMITVDDCALFCRAIGRGSPLIVVHGGPGGSQGYLTAYIDELARDHLVIYYDQRSCGQSTAPQSEEGLGLSHFVEDLDKVRKAFGLEKVSILGHSWGGFLAMHYAMVHPDNVEKLILSNTVPASSEEFFLFIQEHLKRTEPFKKELEALETKQKSDPEVKAEVLRITYRTYCYDPKSADYLDLTLSKAGCANGSHVLQYMAKNVFLKPYNLHMGLGLLSVPTLVIHGDADPIPYETAQHIHQSIRGSEFVLMKECGHFPFVEDYDTYFDHIRAFLK